MGVHFLKIAAEFLKIDVEEDPLLLCTGHTPLTYEGETYTAAGVALAIPEIRKDLSGTSAIRVSFKDGTLTASTIARVNDYKVRGAVATIGRGYFDSETLAQVGGEALFEGVVNNVDLLYRDQTVVAELIPDSQLLGRSRTMRLSAAHQKAIFPGDKAFDFAAGLDLGQIKWPG